jgi:hypothetical protein
MSTRRWSVRRIAAASAVLAGITLATLPLAGSTAGASAGKRALVGTFKLDPGACFGAAVSGTYFRMIFPNGNVNTGKFFDNPDSTCPNKTFTLAVPGTAGGFTTDAFQPNPTPAFSATGGALASAIVQPQGFAAINFSMSTNRVDPQTGKAVPAPSISVQNGKLSGQMTAWSAAWNKLHFNQGSPKPGGRRPGLTGPVTGTYNAKTHAFVLTWTSQVVGGPFNGFTGYWHLSGTFVPR